MNMTPRLFSLALFFVSLSSLAQEPVGTAFTYQGSLQYQGTPATGLFDFQFSLFDEMAEGVLVAGPVDLPGVPVEDGVFSVELDFGQSVFGETKLWLELSVRPGETADPYTPLAPRQALTPTPFALRALSIAPGSVTLDDLVPDCATGELLVMGTAEWRCCAPPTDEVCDGVDNDCDEAVDEGFPEQGLDCGVGECAGGQTECSGDGLSVVCSTDSLITDEACDGVDNDCDDEIDELLPTPCPLTVGVCSGAGNGVACIDGQWLDQCDYGPGFEQSEVSCDGLDNDCDDQIDEEDSVFCPDVTNGMGICQSGGCGYSCNDPFDDCNGLAEDGCEIDISTDVDHCGACGYACALTNAIPSCTAGICEISDCEAGWYDCNGESVDGCESADPCG